MTCTAMTAVWALQPLHNVDAALPLPTTGSNINLSIVHTMLPTCAAGGGNTGSMSPQPVQPSADVGPYSHLGDLGPVASSQLVGFESALLQLGNVLEASLRSCSVLIERFHHSLFLYVLTGLNAYVSVERYIGPLVALICVLVLQVRWGRRTRGCQSILPGSVTLVEA